MTPQETDPQLPVSVQESLAEVWVGSGLLQGWGTECSSTCMVPFEGGHHHLHYLHHSLEVMNNREVKQQQVKQQGGNTAPPINRKPDLRFTEHGPTHQNKTSFPLSQSLPLKCCCSITKNPVFLASGGEEFNQGPETRLDRSEVLCNKVLFKYKRLEKASDIDIRRGQKEYPLASVSNGVIYLLISYWRRQWHPTPVLLPGKSYGWRSWVGCSPWGR